MRHVVEADHGQIDHCGFYTLIHFIEIFMFVLCCLFFSAGLQLKQSVLQGD